MSAPLPTPVIHDGPVPGLLGDVAALHGRYYARHWGFPVFFECKVAIEMAAFLERYDPTRDLVLSVTGSGRILASVTLDGSDPALASGEAHLRWFVVDEPMHGRGLGKRMLTRAITFARDASYRSIYLTTFAGLDAAATLYASAGFRMVSSSPGNTWGREVTEQRQELAL